MKTVAINAILAQGLGFAYGESLALPYGHVLTAMDVSDDIEVGDSYFITESKAILRMIQHLKKPGFHYFFIDELFKGDQYHRADRIRPWDCPLVSCPKLSLHDFQP